MTISAAPASDNRIVWYAGYGSNLLRRRFDCYIKGGKPEGSKKTYSGCRDKNDPRGDLWTIDGGLYSRLMKTGTQDGHPILTFTATRDDFAIGAPSEAYVKMIVSGLEETYPCMRKSEILDYLDMAEGIRGAIQSDVLTR